MVYDETRYSHVNAFLRMVVHWPELHRYAARKTIPGPRANPAVGFTSLRDDVARSFRVEQVCGNPPRASRQRDEPSDLTCPQGQLLLWAGEHVKIPSTRASEPYDREIE
jgi:hypothetical protein